MSENHLGHFLATFEVVDFPPLGFQIRHSFEISFVAPRLNREKSGSD
jgi:hypothetical protein